MASFGSGMVEIAGALGAAKIRARSMAGAVSAPVEVMAAGTAAAGAATAAG
ncbi:MAG TPA: hypothetical protein VGK45_11400 [Thermoanaerobaculia bacterium]